MAVRLRSQHHQIVTKGLHTRYRPSGSCPGTGSCVGPYAISYRRVPFVPVPGLVPGHQIVTKGLHTRYFGALVLCITLTSQPTPTSPCKRWEQTAGEPPGRTYARPTEVRFSCLRCGPLANHQTIQGSFPVRRKRPFLIPTRSPCTPPTEARFSLEDAPKLTLGRVWADTWSSATSTTASSPEPKYSRSTGVPRS
jgi:hypothetical protein